MYLLRSTSGLNSCDDDKCSFSLGLHFLFCLQLHLVTRFLTERHSLNHSTSRNSVVPTPTVIQYMYIVILLCVYTLLS